MKLARGVSLLFLAALLIYAAVDKLFHYAGFLRALDGYVLVPDVLVGFLAPMVISAELLAGLGLLVPAWRASAAWLAALLLAVFTAALVVNQRVAPGAECGCWFTVTLGRATRFHVAQNLLLLGLAITIALDERRRRGLAANEERLPFQPSVPNRGPQPGGVP